MSTVREEFLERLNEITSGRSKYSQAIKKMAGSLLKGKTFEEIEGPLLIGFMRNLSTEIFKYYTKGEGTREEKLKRIPKAVKEFLQFVKKSIPAQSRASQPGDEDFIPCKDPAKESEIKFDDIAGQEEVKRDIEVNYIFPFKLPLLFTSKSQGILMYGPPGTGKCLDPDEKVIMFDGSMKKAKNIQPNDKLMGDDSTPRTVLSICSGEDNMYQIIPNKGESFTVNEPHILTLKCSRRPRIRTCKKEKRYKVEWCEGGKVKTKTFTRLTPESKAQAEDFKRQLDEKPRDVIDIPLNEYMKKSKTWKSFYKGYRVGVDWASKKVPFDPWVIGLWLGDGCSYHPNITNVDQEILDELKDIIGKHNLFLRQIPDDPIRYRIKGHRRENIFHDTLKDLNLYKNKHIPNVYKVNDRSTRLKVLAGLIDSDGYLTCNCYEIIQKSKTLMDDIVFLARSLGFCVTVKEVQKACTNGKNGPVVGTYYRCFISGDGLEEIPVVLSRKKAASRKQIKNANHFGFSVKSLGKGKYCGFTLDGNARFLLKDFTVTHNTLLAKAATAEIPDVAFYTPTPGEMRGKFEGETERFITRVFECAKEEVDNPKSKYKFAIIFIDEFEGIAGQRGDDPGMTRSVNALLQAMDGITSSPNVSVIAATNFPDKIDSAIRRRFTAEIFVDLPTPDAREFLVRQVLAKNYSLPQIPMKERTKDLFSKNDEGRTVWRNDYLDNIEQFGDQFCPEETRLEGTVGFRRERRIAGPINPDFIKLIVERTGPKPEGADTKSVIVGGGGEGVDDDKFGDQGSVFGYSASDVVKMMNIAVQIASFRAMENAFREARLGRDDEESYFVALPIADDDTEYVEYVALESVFERYGGDLANPEGMDNFRLMTPEQKMRAINFGICQKDIEEALRRYPSTIKNSEYIELLKYKYRT